MSDDPKEGVVDSNLKVHGTENVYVCSNASFSSLGAVNPTLTLTALSLRLAKHLVELRGCRARAFAALPGDLAITTPEN
jgi:choline dehydrogenase-like flavoprotein